MFSTLGPDTLKELRGVAGAARVHSFVDMHDLGDMLVAAGFSAPVMEMEMISIDYGRARSARRLARAARPARAPTAPADSRRALCSAALRAQRATFEVVYGHAWSPPKANQPAKTIRVFKRMP